MIASRKLDPARRLAAEVEQTGGKRLAVACHVGEWRGRRRLADAAYARFGHVDVLVNNAGMSPLYPRSSTSPRTLYDKVLDVNLKGPFRLTALIGRRMAAGDGGSIINVSSVAADPADANEIALRRRQGRPQRHDRRLRPGLRAQRCA